MTAEGRGRGTNRLGRCAGAQDARAFARPPHRTLSLSLTLARSLSLSPTQVRQTTGMLPSAFVPTSNERNELMLKEVCVRERERERGERGRG